MSINRKIDFHENEIYERQAPMVILYNHFRMAELIPKNFQVASCTGNISLDLTLYFRFLVIFSHNVRFFVYYRKVF